MGQVKFKFDNHILDTDRRELRCGGDLVAMQPQVFDLLVHLLKHRDRVVTRDDLIALVWGGRIVSTRHWTAGSTPPETRSATMARNSDLSAPFPAREFALSALLTRHAI